MVIYRFGRMGTFLSAAAVVYLTLIFFSFSAETCARASCALLSLLGFRVVRLNLVEQIVDFDLLVVLLFLLVSQSSSNANT